MLDGYEATRQIKSLAGFAAVPIIAVSSFAMKGDEEKERAAAKRSGAKSEGRFASGEKLKYRFTAGEHGQRLHRYWTDACQTCPIKAQCRTGRERRFTRWEHKEVVEAVQERLDQNPGAMRTRRETLEHPFALMKMRMAATHFLMWRPPRVATKMALRALAYNITRELNIIGIGPMMAAANGRFLAILRY